MQQKKRKYARMSGLDRTSIENGLDQGRSIRYIAARIGRSPSSVSKEIERNRTVARGRFEGQPFRPSEEAAAAMCRRLRGAPWVCNGCPRHGRTCASPRQAVYSSARANRLAAERLREARRGVDRTQEQMERVLGVVRADLARGLSPAQIASARAAELRVSASTLYRWIGRGYCGMSAMELRRAVGYRPRRRAAPSRPTAHGARRAHERFSALGEERRAAAVEMDTVMGRRADSRCVLTLYHRPSKLQLALLLDRCAAGDVAAALDRVESVMGFAAFKRVFGTLLTDNGAEFSDPDAMERSRSRASRRCAVYYCDARASQQKGGCERNHVELRKILPKGRFAFDDLEPADMAVAMSHLNSEPRPSLGGLTPAAMFLAQTGREGRALLDGLGVEEVPYSALDLTGGLIDASRAERGLPPLRRAADI